MNCYTLSRATNFGDSPQTEKPFRMSQHSPKLSDIAVVEALATTAAES